MSSPNLIQIRITLISFILLTNFCLCLATSNICTFSIEDKFFSFVNLENQNPYKLQFDNDNDEQLQLSFCLPFVPLQCPKDTLPALSFVISENDNKTQCQSYSSDSTIYNFNTTYTKNLSTSTSFLLITYQTTDTLKKTILNITCAQQNQFKIQQFHKIDNSTVYIAGTSSSGCPMFQISQIWRALVDNEVLFGLILFVLGIQSLFFGRTMLVVTIFVAGYLLSFALLAALATTFIGPNSRILLIYFTLIVILFVSTMLAYGITKLVGISIFFIGAWFGFIIGALFNSLFSGIFRIYSTTSLIIFQILFTIPCGLLTFRFSDEIIILSTSLTGSYMIIRPISWILGGFPNQFLLQELYRSGRLNTIPGSFFVYLIFIIALSIVGALYQFLKLRRQDQTQQVQVSFFQQKIENSVDKVKSVLDGIIARYKSGNEPKGEQAQMAEFKKEKRFSDYQKI